ncbi:MAG: phosphatidate cytidylyltransferase [Ignavibacteriae bacterium]|nr:phosphatidate cytidylyltransferase [Ignavibacteria bacterium]MBI3363614.1 phosphatidate cytidylyltransferase [Ignavibacteriota bacterium]
MNNLTQRILVAAVAIPIIVFICMAGGLYFFGFIAIVSAVALREFYALAEAKGAKPLVVFGLIGGFFVNLSFYHVRLRTFLTGIFEARGITIPFPSQAQLLVITLLIIVIVFSIRELFRDKGSAVLNLSTTLFGILYVSLFFGTFIGLRELFVPADFPVLRYFPSITNLADQYVLARIYKWGGYTVISVFAMIWICDSAAFHAGSAIGKHKLFPRVSPNKSWEGAAAGFIFAILSALAAKYLVLEYLSVGSAVLIGGIVGTIGQLGDLSESLMKRDAGVKDSSTLIPGHGGAFDRFDSLLLVAPCVYLYIDYILFS